jgi:hypothetical protein
LQCSTESNQVKRIGEYREFVWSYLALDIQNTLFLNFWALLMLGETTKRDKEKIRDLFKDNEGDPGLGFAGKTEMTTSFVN